LLVLHSTTQETSSHCCIQGPIKSAKVSQIRPTVNAGKAFPQGIKEEGS